MDSVNECARDVPNMNVVSFEMRFKQHDCPVVNGAIYEIIDQQIDSHSGRHTEYRRETKTDAVAASAFVSRRYSVWRPERESTRSEEHTSELQSPDHLAC